MADWIFWLTLAGVIVILELFTGTFYLLMVALGLIAGGLAALAGVSIPFQFIAAGVVGSIATYGLRRSKLGKTSSTDAARDPNVNLDIGQTLSISEWKNADSAQNDMSGTTRVMYRGAMWDVDLAAGATAQPGVFVIREIRGSRLIVVNQI